MKLKYKTVMYNEIDYKDFEKFVQKVYGWKQYEYAYCEEVSNDSRQSYTADKEELDEWALEKIQRLNDGESESFCANFIFNKLCLDGYLPPGNYLINVCW